MRPITCLEPACGQGHMVKVLTEYFGGYRYSGPDDYGFGPLRNFLAEPYPAASFDWLITNPPFRTAEMFLAHSLRVARRGLALLCRTMFLESVARYQEIFRNRPPTKVAQFVERVPMVRGRLDRKASATGYARFVWEKDVPSGPPRLVWIPPCQGAGARLGLRSGRRREPG